VENPIQASGILPKYIFSIKRQSIFAHINSWRYFMKKYLIYLLAGVCIVSGACSTGDAAAAVAKMLGGSSQALLFINCKAVSENEIEFEFSHPVTVKSLRFEPALEIASVQDGNIVRVKLEANPSPGVQIIADLVAEDKNRNSINVLVPFRARNNRMPALVINELCTEYTTVAAGRKPEFIEFKMKSAGNLGAMRVVILGNTNASRRTVFEFMPVEVKEGEYVVLHLRTVDESNVNEYGDDLSLSGGVNASPTARDFWIPGNSKLIHKAASVVYVLDQDDNVLDAVMISATPDAWWNRDYFAEAATFLFEKGAWKSPEGKIGSPADAVNSNTTTGTRTICRDETKENTNTAADWYITATSGATPGKPNNPRRHQ
jgi:hypothetical protein